MAPAEISTADAAWLERGRELARRGWGRTHPNPMVGCVVVRDGAVVGEGWHAEFGGAHAEVAALDAAGAAARGATAYVTLEPCDHHGKTPPCAKALLDAGVRRVVYGAADPGAESGGGARTLAKGGVEVVGPVWGSERAWAENPAFHHGVVHATPFVALKLAMGLDGAIAARAGVRTRITGIEAEREVHRLRAGFDAVMVGAGTVQADDPRLTPRLVGAGRLPPARVLVLPDAELPADAAVFEDVRDHPVHVFCHESASESAMERLEAGGAHVHPVPGTPNRLDLTAVLGRCHELGMTAILCEGGAELAHGLLLGRHVQRLYLFVAPRTLGAEALPAFGPDRAPLDWTGFVPVIAPATFGADTLIVLDRPEA